MCDNDSILGAVEQAESALGTIDILVNNAGIPDAQRAHKMPLDLIDRVFDTNLRGPYILSCEVARRLIAAKMPGRMVNISSIGGFNYSNNGAALYSITKSAIVRMTECLAVEWARFDINVNAIAPGAFSSEMMDGMVERMGDIARFFPRKRICDPPEMDSTLLYFLSPASGGGDGNVHQDRRRSGVPISPNRQRPRRQSDASTPAAVAEPPPRSLRESRRRGAARREWPPGATSGAHESRTRSPRCRARSFPSESATWASARPP